MGLAVVSCAGVPDARVPARPDILLISIDTLRADHLSCYGHPRRTTPFIDRIAAEGVRFSRAYSTTSWTAPALASMLTSSYPTRHGVDQTARGDDPAWGVIPEDLPSLPELLRQHGYRTYGLTANFSLPAERGFGRGFDRYRCVGAVGVDKVREEAAGWLVELSDPAPWFFWLHLFDPHAPYEAREPWLTRVEPAPAVRHADLDHLPAERIPALVPGLDAGRLDYLKTLYDSEIRAVDDYLHELFEAVPRAREALVLIVADHGEEFLEHGGTLHGKTLFEEVVRIPFILRSPDRALAGSVSDRPVSLVDVLPTLVQAAGIPVPAGVAGAALVGPAGLQVPDGRPLVAELSRGEATTRAWIDGNWKFIVRGGQGGGLLYDLDSDPGEHRDLSPEQAQRAERYAEAIAAFSSRQEPPSGSIQTPLTPEQVAALEALGYVD